MAGDNFEELLMAELEKMCQHLRGLGKRLVEEHKRSLGGVAAGTPVRTVSVASGRSEAWVCLPTDHQEADDLDATSIGVPEVSDPIGCTNLDVPSGFRLSPEHSEDSYGLDGLPKAMKAGGCLTPVPALKASSGCHGPPPLSKPSQSPRTSSTSSLTLKYSMTDSHSLGRNEGRAAAIRRAKVFLAQNDAKSDTVLQVGADELPLQEPSEAADDDVSVEDVVSPLASKHSKLFSMLSSGDGSYEMSTFQGAGSEPGSRRNSVSSPTQEYQLVSRRPSVVSAGSAEDETNSAVSDKIEIFRRKQNFQVLEVWTDGAARQTMFGLSTARATNKATISTRKTICDVDKEGFWEGFEDKPLWLRFLTAMMVSPSSYKHLCWDLAAVLLIIFDIIVVPLQLLDPPSTLALGIMILIVRLFWTADFIMSFLTGYIDITGEAVMKVGPVARRYAKTWMVPDFCMVLLDWAEVVAKGSVTYGGPGQPRIAGIISSARLTRVVRLIRLTKAREVTEFIIEHVQSENIILIADILKIVAVMLALTHLIACAWYGLGKHGESWQRSWVKYRGLEEEVLMERYIWSFHCAIAFWTGEHIVLPRSTMERAFLAAMMIVTFMLSVWFVSCMTTAMTRLQIIAGQHSVQFSALSRYLCSKKISQELSAKVLRNAQYALEERKRNADESGIDLLYLISEPLRTELHYEVYSPTLMIHPFFRLFAGVHPTGIRKICHTTLAKMSYSRGDVVFTEEVPVAPKMFFILHGMLLYVQERTRQSKVGHRHWMAEMVLWTSWSHRGTLHAAEDCQLLAMDAVKFSSVVSKFPGNQVHDYAEHFVARLRDLEMFELTDVGTEDETALDLAAQAFETEEGEQFDKRESVFSVSSMATVSTVVTFAERTRNLLKGGPTRVRQSRTKRKEKREKKFNKVLPKHQAKDEDGNRPRRSKVQFSHRDSEDSPT